MIEESDCLEIAAQNKRSNVFIFRTFAGDVFEQARKYKSPYVNLCI